MQRQRSLPFGPAVGHGLEPAVEEQHELLEAQPVGHTLVQGHLGVHAARLGLEEVSGDIDDEGKDGVKAVAVVGRELLDAQHRVDYVRQRRIQ